MKSYRSFPSFVFFLVALSTVVPVYAQEHRPAGDGAAPVEVPCHIIVKQVPVDGTLESFTGKLRDAGMTFLGIREDMGLLEGRFAGVDGAKLYAFATGGVTWKAVVEFPAFENWTSAKKQYLFFKQSFASKYMTEPRSVERFPNYCPEGSAREHVAFKEETAVYSSVFAVPNGTVTLSVQPVISGRGRLFVQIEYVDELNSMLRDTELFSDL